MERGMRRAAEKIMKGLKEALAVARGEAEPFRVTTYEPCDGCGNVTRTKNGRCGDCNHLKPESSKR